MRLRMGVREELHAPRVYAAHDRKATNRSVELLAADDTPQRETRAVVGHRGAADPAVRLVPAVRPDDRREQAVGEDARVSTRIGRTRGLRLLDQPRDELLVRAPARS